MGKGKRNSHTQRFDGLILPLPGENLRPLWRAFEKGPTWYRRGKRRPEKLRLGHTTYAGRIDLEWWGDAVRYWIEDDGSGKISGAFLGHAQRHGSSCIDRIDMTFSD